MASQQGLAELWYSTKHPYYRDVYLKAYGQWLPDDMPTHTQPISPLAGDSDQSQTYEFLNQVDELLRLAGAWAQQQAECPQLPFKFLELPAEIRNKIYRLAYRHQEVVTGTTAIPAIGLLATCKQVHEEASSILYGENSFSFTATIDFQFTPQIHLSKYPDTQKMELWPPKTYHRHLKALHIKFNFNGGEDKDLNPPPIFSRQIQAMRDAFDEAWENLALTIEFLRLPEYGFTTFWLKMRLFEPLYHPDCEILLPDGCKNAKLAHFILDQLLSDRLYCNELSREQKIAEVEATRLVRFSYLDRPYSRCGLLASRMAFADPDYTWLAMLGMNGPRLELAMGGPALRPTPQQLALQPTQPTPIFIPVGPRTRARKCEAILTEDLVILLGAKNADTTDWLLKDSQLRVYAALKFPDKSKYLLPKSDLEMKIYKRLVIKLAASWREQNEKCREALSNDGKTA